MQEDNLLTPSLDIFLPSKISSLSNRLLPNIPCLIQVHWNLVLFRNWQHWLIAFWRMAWKLIINWRIQSKEPLVFLGWNVYMKGKRKYLPSLWGIVFIYSLTKTRVIPSWRTKLTGFLTSYCLSSNMRLLGDDEPFSIGYSHTTEGAYSAAVWWGITFATPFSSTIEFFFSSYQDF